MPPFPNLGRPTRRWLLLVVASAAAGCARPSAATPEHAAGGTVPDPGHATAPPDGHPDPRFLDAAARYQGKTLAEWTAELKDADDLNRSAAADAVAKYGPNAGGAVPGLLPLLKNPTDLSFTSALAAIGAIGPAAGGAVDPLVGLLKAGDAGTRALAAGTLADLGPAAGRAVPALIAALGEARTDADRDAFRYPIQRLGKHDVRAVFAAVRRGVLGDADLGFVTESLGPGDAQAVAPLTDEVTKRDGLVFHALGGLRRIGPGAAASLPAIRALLDDPKPDVRRSAEEALAAVEPKTGLGAGKKGAPAPEAAKTAGAEDIRGVLERAGFDPKSDWASGLAPYARFGSKQTADRFARGDKFDKIEITAAAREHRDAVRQKSFRVTGLKFRPVVRDDVATRGLVAELALPMRVRGAEPFHADRAAFSGVLAGLHPSELDAVRSWFLAKDGTLKPCTPAEARLLEKNGGVIYHPERGNTILILVFKDGLDALKALARDARDHTVEFTFSELCYQRPPAWGYFRWDAYSAADWDCQRLWEDYLRDTGNPQPPYFPIALGKEDEAKIPEVVRARLDSLRVLNKDGKVIGGYRAGP